MEYKSYFNNNDLIYNVWKSKYQYNDESPDGTIQRIAKAIADNELRYKNNYTDEKTALLSEYGQQLFKTLYHSTDKDYTYNIFYNLLKDYGKLIPGGSILATLGTDKKSTLSNCYVVESPKDSVSSIIDSIKITANIFKRRGGCGCDISNLRPRGANVNNAASSSTGAVSFMNFYSVNAETIGAEARRAAQMISISDRHPDIEEFIKIKSDLSKIPGANLSIMLSRDLKNAALQDKDWNLCFPVDNKFLQNYGDHCSDYSEIPYDTLIQTGENQYIKKVKAKKLFDMIIYHAHKFAEPGILLKDNLFDYDPSSVYEDLKFVSTNPLILAA